MNTRIRTVILSLLLTFLLTACAPSTPVAEEVLWHMDTAITVRLYGEDEQALQDAITSCDVCLDALDSQLSATDDSSPVARFNSSPDGRDVTIPREVVDLIAKAMLISDRTGGAFDVTSASLTVLWQQCETDGTLPEDEQLTMSLSLVGQEHLSLGGDVLTKDVPDVRIDLGGIGKGYACDVLLAELKANEGVSAAIISMGSNVAVLGEKPDGSPWKIALRDPNDATAAVGYIHLTEGMILSVSGDYERYFTIDGKHYSHILDPATGYPPENGLRSVAVLSSDGATADALSTAFMVMGEDAARALQTSGTFAFEAIFVYDSPSGARVSMTDGIRLER